MSKPENKPTGPVQEINDPVEDNPYLEADSAALAGFMREVLARSEEEKKKVPADTRQDRKVK